MMSYDPGVRLGGFWTSKRKKMSSVHSSVKNDPRISSPGPVWLFFLGNASIEEMADLYVPINCIVVTAFLNRDVIELVEVYQPTHHFPLQRNPIFVGKLDDLSPSHLNVTMERKNYIKDMFGFGLKVSVIHNPPLSILTYGENSLNVTGFLPEVWEIAEKIINFTTLYIPTRDKVFGAVVGNGSWSGMMGALLRNETDAALGLTATLQRSYFVDFCLPIIFTSYRVYIRDYGNVTAPWQNFILPFTRSLWIGILICFVISAMILSVSEYVHKMNETVKSSFPLVMNESLFGIFAVFFCQQANVPESKYATSRIVVFSMFLTSIILFGAYSGALVSHLTVKRSRNSFTSIHDLIEEGSYTMAVISSSAMLSQFTPRQTSFSRNPKEIAE
ncbi:Ionotropic receptor 25a [Gryllus bimaculatus]|nr:Ionotropic receptor 25a [Gryllus bimaculatus]